MPDVLTDELWRKMINDINACPPQYGSKAIASVAKLCHEINVTYMNQHPDSLGEETQIQYEVEGVASLLRPEAFEGRTLQDGDKEQAVSAESSKCYLSVGDATLLMRTDLRHALHILKTKGLEMGSAEGLSDEMFSYDNEGARDNLQPEAPKKFSSMKKEHRKFHQKAFPTLNKCLKAPAGSVERRQLEEKLKRLNEEIVNYNTRSELPLSTGCIEYSKVIQHWEVVGAMSPEQFYPQRKGSRMIMAGLQLPAGWGKRRPQHDNIYLAPDALERAFAEGLVGDDDEDDDEDEDEADAAQTSPPATLINGQTTDRMGEQAQSGQTANNTLAINQSPESSQQAHLGHTPNNAMPMNQTPQIGPRAHLGQTVNNPSLMSQTPQIGQQARLGQTANHAMPTNQNPQIDPQAHLGQAANNPSPMSQTPQINLQTLAAILANPNALASLQQAFAPTFTSQQGFAPGGTNQQTEALLTQPARSWFNQPVYQVNAVPTIPVKRRLRPGYTDDNLPIKAYRNFNKQVKQYVVETKPGLHEILAQSECVGSVIWKLIESMPREQRPPEIGLRHHGLSRDKSFWEPKLLGDTDAEWIAIGRSRSGIMRAPLTAIALRYQDPQVGTRTVVMYRSELQAIIERKPADKFIARHMHGEGSDFSSFRVAHAAKNPQNFYAFPDLQGTPYAYPSPQQHFAGQLAASQPAGCVPVAAAFPINQPTMGQPAGSFPTASQAATDAVINAQVMQLISQRTAAPPQQQRSMHSGNMYNAQQYPAGGLNAFTTLAPAEEEEEELLDGITLENGDSKGEHPLQDLKGIDRYLRMTIKLRG